VKAAGRLVLVYAGIAALATVANLATQAAVVHIVGGPHAIALSVLAGTAAGLPIKYVLEKKLIFGFTATSLQHDGRLFMLYSFLGVFTTLLFWATEYAFHVAFGSHAMRLVGGAIGLTAGYIIKYHLDKRFVFVTPPAHASTRGLA